MFGRERAIQCPDPQGRGPCAWQADDRQRLAGANPAVTKRIVARDCILGNGAQ
jgi:hypothetical protein